MSRQVAAVFSPAKPEPVAQPVQAAAAAATDTQIGDSKKKDRAFAASRAGQGGSPTLNPSTGQRGVATLGGV